MHYNIFWLFVGVPRVELGTSSLSVTRSNHLSYTPVGYKLPENRDFYKLLYF